MMVVYKKPYETILCTFWRAVHNFFVYFQVLDNSYSVTSLLLTYKRYFLPKMESHMSVSPR